MNERGHDMHGFNRRHWLRSAGLGVIGVHSHLTWTTHAAKGVSTGEEVTFNTTPKDALAVMDRKGIRAMVNLTGGTGKGLARTIAAFDQAHSGRFFSCTEPSYGELLDPRY